MVVLYPLCNFVFQLVLTVGLLAVVVYLYTVVAFNFFRKFYNKSEDGDMPDMKCDDMLTVSFIMLSVFFLKMICFCPELLVVPVHIVVSLASNRKDYNRRQRNIMNFSNS